MRDIRRRRNPPINGVYNVCKGGEIDAVESNVSKGSWCFCSYFIGKFEKLEN
jgi:hypothetical protein